MKEVNCEQGETEHYSIETVPGGNHAVIFTEGVDKMLFVQHLLTRENIELG
jgi:hypothetical protein